MVLIIQTGIRNPGFDSTPLVSDHRLTIIATALHTSAAQDTTLITLVSRVLTCIIRAIGCNCGSTVRSVQVEHGTREHVCQYVFRRDIRLGPLTDPTMP